MYLFIAILMALISHSNAMYLMYLTGQHNIVPAPNLISDITHVALAFMRSEVFNSPSSLNDFPLFTSVNDVQAKFATGTKVMVAIGGWGDTEGFSTAAKTAKSRELFAENVRIMIEQTGADGVDIDWEYPGGNGEDYNAVPNSLKEWEITAYPLLLAAIRNAIGPNKQLSAAVPGLPRDMLAFTNITLPQISSTLDFFNIMTYDLMNRRDVVTKHHTGIDGTLTALDAYLDGGVPVSKANLGFAFYVKWFRVEKGQSGDDVGRKTLLMEDPVTGGDLGMAGAFAWCDEVPEELRDSFEKAMVNGRYEEVGGGHFYLDEEEGIWWSWDDPEAILKKKSVIDGRGVGAFAWGLGEDSRDWRHLKALNEVVGGRSERLKDEL